MRLISSQKGFTLVELLVVISIIGFLATSSIVTLDNARKKARDTRRLADISQIRKALEVYYQDNNQYPPNTDSDYGGWDVGFYGANDTFISSLSTAKIMKNVPGDPLFNLQASGYRYHRYAAGYSNCDVNKGDFYVIGIVDMETGGYPYPGSPGWRCPDRNWQLEFDWVTGGFVMN